MRASGTANTGRDPERRRRFKRDQIREVCHNIPRWLWLEASGRSGSVLVQQARRYGLPIDEAQIDLYKLAPALHDFLARNSRLFSQAGVSGGTGDDEGLLDGASSPNLEKWRGERFLITQMERFEREKTLVSREEIHQRLSRLAELLRSCGEAMMRQFGPAAAALIEETLEAFRREVETGFGREEEPAEDAESRGNGKLTTKGTKSTKKK